MIKTVLLTHRRKGIGLLIIISLIIHTSACQVKKDSTRLLSPFVLSANDEQSTPAHFNYQGSKTLKTDILHTELHLQFDWEKKEVYGKAILTVKPHFYPTNQFEFDAKAFSFQAVAVSVGKKNIPFNYSYNNYQLRIETNDTLSRRDTLRFEIDYTAHPYNIAAYCPDLDPYAHGLYFIKPDEITPSKPYQIWTQNEPEDASLWFPTHENTINRMTQELHITVGDSMQTLSNGILIKSEKHSDGTRTDIWKQDKPHASYLTAVIIGQYSIIKDQYKNIPVWYYVEPAYEPYAHSLFGHTVEMIDFFSTKLGVPYPWDKFHQVFVRDYVSGAMENTTCVVLGEFMQLTNREQPGSNFEETFAHELFHHWFGNLVTCESWAQLPLNESFANYSEYLWIEHKYGKEAADIYHHNEMLGYKEEALTKNVDLIRYYHKGSEDMFDSHSYAKGGRILHMLRHLVGDDAFFASLRLYLIRHAFQSVEADQLRIAFEDVTGKDLNWFFNQWFFNKGYPKLYVQYAYHPETKKQTVTIEQIQPASFAPIYRLPIDLALYFDGKAERTCVWLDSAKQTFSFPVQRKPDWINIDESGVLLADIFETKSATDYLQQYKQGSCILDKLKALKYFGTLDAKAWHTEINQIILDALHYPNATIREEAIRLIPQLPDTLNPYLTDYLKQTIRHDTDPNVRIAAIQEAEGKLPEKEFISVLSEAVNDSAWIVVNEAIDYLIEYETDNTILLLLNTINKKPIASSFYVEAISILKYLDEFDDKLMPILLSLYDRLTDPNDKMTFLHHFGDYMCRVHGDKREIGYQFLFKVIESDPMWFTRAGAYHALILIIENDRALANKEKDKDLKKIIQNRIDSAVSRYDYFYSRERNADLLNYIVPMK
ncbi:MAG: M1 family metallopeptidase [Flavobacteriales bacterium]|nr:M1 family metallopeptidase [Flavobacteriales bacterium]